MSNFEFDPESVELTEEEKQKIIDGALQLALTKKIGDAKTKAYWDKIKADEKESIVTAGWYKKKLENRAIEIYGVDDEGKCKFKIDEFNSDIFNNLYRYFYADKQSKYDLDKGILLLGNTGTGKSNLMDLFRFNPKCSYVIKSARMLADDYSDKDKGGAQYLKKYSGLIKNTAVELSFGQKEIGLCIDDAGTEVDSMHMGNRINVIENLILNRYDNKSFLKSKTHITTNYGIKEMEERYGYRVRSRLSEMFNLVVMPSSTPDRRRNY